MQLLPTKEMHHESSCGTARQDAAGPRLSGASQVAKNALLRHLIGVACIALSWPVSALVIGEPISVSGYGEPLAVEIELMTEPKEPLDQLVVTVEFLGDDQPELVETGVYAANHTAYLRIASPSRQWRPELQIQVRISWVGGSVSRPYHLTITGAP